MGLWTAIKSFFQLPEWPTGPRCLYCSSGEVYPVEEPRVWPHSQSPTPSALVRCWSCGKTFYQAYPDGVDYEVRPRAQYRAYHLERQYETGSISETTYRREMEKLEEQYYREIEAKYGTDLAEAIFNDD